MPLGIVSDDEFNEMLNELEIKKRIIIVPDEPAVNKNIDNKEQVKPAIDENKVYTPEIVQLKHGRGIGTKEVPLSIRKLVASEAIAGANVNEISELFNVSKSSISAYKNDATSTASYNDSDEQLKKANDAVRNNIVGRAQKSLLDAIAAITVEKLNESKVNIASSVARDMSTVMRNISPADNSGSNNNNRVIIYQPRMREEDDYEVIHVSE